MYVPAWQGVTLAQLLRQPKGRRLPYPLNAPHRTFFHTARNGIYHLFRNLVAAGRRTVLVPDYHHGNEVKAIRAAGADILFYPIGRDLQPDGDRLRRMCGGAHVLFVIHFVGWPQPIEDLSALCAAHGLTLVEDCALSLLTDVSRRPIGTWGDYAVFCLYKTLPIPDGGVLVQNRRIAPELERLSLSESGRAFLAGRTVELWLERFRSNHDRSGRMFALLKRRMGRLLTRLQVERVPVGDMGFNLEHVNLGMAELSKRLLARFDYEEIRCRRRENFHLLCQELDGYGRPLRTDLKPGVCPLFFPLPVADKAAAARSLRSHGIMATEFWNEGDRSAASHEGPDARWLRRHVLELPIHQDLTEGHIAHMARHVRQLDLCLPTRVGERPLQATA